MIVKDIIVVKKEHIQAGIEKYKGVIDSELLELLSLSGLNAKPYLFADGRVLLVYQAQDHGILYASKKVLFDKLDLT
jgi:hypothetical protein